jgi:hypothetical protein
MKKIFLSLAIMLTAVMTAQEVQMPQSGQVCNNTEFNATAKVYHGEIAITTGTWYFAVNQTGATFKESGTDTYTVVVPASSGIYLTTVVNSGASSGGLTVGFRINAPNYSTIGGQASTWVNDCLACGGAKFSSAQYPINTVTQFNTNILNAGIITYKLEPNTSGAFFVTTGTSTYTTTAVEGSNSVDVNVGNVAGAFTGNVVDSQGNSKCSASSNAVVIESITTTATERHIGDPTKTPNLQIVELDQANLWQGRTRPFGIRAPMNYLLNNYSVGKNETTGMAELTYNCPIANKAPIDYSGQNDFVVCMPCDGITNETSAQYQFEGMLSIVTFQNGLPIGETIKQSFWVTPTDWMVGYNYNQQVRWDVTDGLYNNKYMMIPAGTADSYGNRAPVKEGKCLIVVEINPDLLITESNYNDNVSTLPVNISSLTDSVGTAVLDLSAIDENKTHPPTNIIITKNFKGANKTITLDWDCPYHAPIYVKHWFTLKKNGVVIADKFDESIFVDTVPGSFKSATYEIIIHVTGLGESQPTNITVKR